MTVVWSQAALQELRAIYNGLEAGSSVAALRLIERFAAASERLGLFPELGAVIQRFDDPHLRELAVGNYRLAYHLGAGEVEILAVFHGSLAPFD